MKVIDDVQQRKKERLWKRQWRERGNNREKERQQQTKWRVLNKSKVKKYKQTDYKKRRKKCLMVAKKRYKKFADIIKPRHAEYNRQRHREFKRKVFFYYGGKPPRCSCCNETEFDFLSLDHKNGDGAEHRKKINQARIYKDLIDNGFPQGYQILCMNCNFARSFPYNKGICPHKK